MIDHLSNTNYNAVYRESQVKSQSAIVDKTALNMYSVLEAMFLKFDR